jgi:hypothetical protein
MDVPLADDEDDEDDGEANSPNIGQGHSKKE